MGVSRFKLASTLARLEHDGLLPDDGPTSVFLTQGGHGGHAVQLSVRVSGDAVFVRMSRLPFIRPLVFSRRALREDAPTPSEGG